MANSRRPKRKFIEIATFGAWLWAPRKRSLNHQPLLGETPVVVPSDGGFNSPPPPKNLPSIDKKYPPSVNSGAAFILWQFAESLFQGLWYLIPVLFNGIGIGKGNR